MLTILGALSHTGMLAVMPVDAATDREVFRADLDQVPCPRLRPRGEMLQELSLAARTRY